MLHELLMALSGYAGGIFVEDSESGSIKVRCNSFLYCHLEVCEAHN